MRVCVRAVQVCMRRLAAGYFCLTHWQCRLCVFQVWVSGAGKCSPECVRCAQGTSALLRPGDRGFVLQCGEMRADLMPSVFQMFP